MNTLQIGQLNVTERAKYDNHGTKAISSLSFTATGNALIAFDNMSTMYICRLSPITDPGIYCSLINKNNIKVLY